MPLQLRNILGFRSQIDSSGSGGGGGSFNGETLTFTGASGANQILIPDNLAQSLIITQGANQYQRFITTDNAEAVTFLKGMGVTEGTATAAGANQGTATVLTNQITYVTSGNGAGVRLPASRPAGETWIVYNATATNPGVGLLNAINVYPATGESILPMAANIRDQVPGAQSAMYVSLGSGTWRNLDSKSDHVNFLIGYTYNFYATPQFLNGINVTNGSVATVGSGGALDVAGNFATTQGATSTTAGTTITLSWLTASFHHIDLEGASGNVTLTLNSPRSGGRYTIKVTQGSVARNLVWPAAVKWPGGVAPTITITNDAIDFIQLYYDGTNYLATYHQNFT